MIFKLFSALSYVLVLLGSVGMILFSTKFPFMTDPKDYAYSEARLLKLNGYQFWRGSWALIIAGTLIQLVLAIGVPKFDSEPMRSLSASTEDGTAVSATLQLRRAACVEKDGPEDCYYYIVEIHPRVNFDPETNGFGEPLNSAHCGYFTRVHLSFYDSDGFSLYSGSENTFAPGWSNNADELVKIDGGWRWKGRFGMENIPPTQFGRIVKNKPPRDWPAPFLFANSAEAPEAAGAWDYQI